MTAPCIVAGCTSKTTRRIKGACGMHDMRLRTTGSYGPPGRLRGEWHSSCPAEGCDARGQRRGYCYKHARRVALYGDPAGQPEKKPERPCRIDGCPEPHWARDYCRRHYKRWKKNGTAELLTADDRFWRKVDRRGPDECWPWRGATVRGTHGHVRLDDGSLVYAHRRSFEIHNGAIPEGLVVRHKCDFGLCVNPDHLEIGTQADNVRDMVDRGRGHWQGKPNVCQRGHEFTPENTYNRRGGGRSCRTCIAASRMRRRGISEYRIGGAA